MQLKVKKTTDNFIKAISYSTSGTMRHSISTFLQITTLLTDGKNDNIQYENAKYFICLYFLI